MNFPTKNFPHTALRISGIILLVIFAFYGGFVFRSVQYDTTDSSLFPVSLSNILTKKVEFSLVEEVWEKIHTKYAGGNTIDDTKLIYGAIRGMVGSLEDPYTVFFDPQETKQFLESVNGRFEGIGAEIGIRDGSLIIVAPLKNTPAERAGLLAGDKIRAIEGKDTVGISVEAAVTAIRGEKDTTVTLRIERSGIDKPFDVAIVRDTIVVPSLRWEIKKDGIAVISFYQFSENAAQDFQRAANDILQSSARGIVLDLRNNPGGYLNTSVQIAGWFLPKNSLVVTEDFGGEKMQEHRAQGPSSLSQLPLVVIINKGSASASEILAGALFDHRNIPLIGTQTFGKGTVQELEELRGGSSLKLTVAQWLTPSGRIIQNEGIAPTLIVEEGEKEQDTQMEKAQETLKQMIGI